MEETVKAAVEAVVKAAAKAAANVVAEVPLGELGGPSKPVVIELDNDETKSYNKGIYAAFKEAIKVENCEASYIETL